MLPNQFTGAEMQWAERLRIKWLASVDPKYAQYNESNSRFFLYKFLRCGTAHIMRSNGPILSPSDRIARAYRACLAI